MSRKKRSDRNHVIYEIVNTSNGKSYLGIAACIGRRVHYSAWYRFNRHCWNAKNLTHIDRSLYRDMRENDREIYELFIVDVVRGKKLAHQIEVDLLKEFDYELNDKKQR